MFIIKFYFAISKILKKIIQNRISIHSSQCLGQILFIICIGSTPHFSQANEKPLLRKSTVLVVENETTTINWARDLGIFQSDILSCKALNSAAEWYDLCQDIKKTSDGITTFSRLNSDSTQIKPPHSEANIQITTEQGFVNIQFISIPVFRFSEKNKIEKIHSLKIKYEKQTQSITCQHESESKLIHNPVFYTLYNSQTKLKSRFENPVIPLKYANNFTFLNCHTTLFDGILFHQLKTTEKISNIVDQKQNRALFSFSESNPMQDIFIKNEIANAPQFNSCKQLFPTNGFNVCSYFDSQTQSINLKSGDSSTKEILPFQTNKFVRLNLNQTFSDKPDQSAQFDFYFYTTENPMTEADLIQNWADGPYSLLTCVLPGSNLSSGTKVQWSINKKPLIGWSQPWIPNYLLEYNGEYSCNIGSIKSKKIKFIPPNLQLLGPTEIPINQDSTRQFIRLELSDYVDFPNAVWDCKSTSHLKCTILGHKFDLGRTIQIDFNSKDSQINEFLEVTFATEVQKIYKTIRIYQQNTIQKPPQESRRFKISQNAENHTYTCTDSEFSDHLLKKSKHWYIDNKLFHSETEGDVLKIDENKFINSIACVVEYTQNNGDRFISLDEIFPKNHTPILIPKSKMFLLESQKSNTFKLFIESKNSLVYKIECQLYRNNLKLTQTNLCVPINKIISKNLSNSTSEIIVHINKKESDAIIKSLVSDPVSDSSTINNLSLIVTLEHQSLKFVLRSEGILSVANHKPEIPIFLDFPLNLYDHACFFLATDADRNHLNATLFWGPHSATPFSTLFDQTSLQNSLAVIGLKDLPLPNGGLAGISINSNIGMKLANPFRSLPSFFSFTQKEVGKCRIYVTDGTLITASHSIPQKNSDDVENRVLSFLSRELQKNKTQLTELRPSVESYLTELTELKNNDRHDSEMNHPIQIEFESLNPKETENRVIKKNVLKINSCLGSRTQCDLFSVTKGNLSISSKKEKFNSKIQISITTLDTKSSILILESQIQSPDLKQSLSDEEQCSNLIDLNFSNAIPFSQKLNLTAVFKRDGQEKMLPISPSVFTRALSMGAKDIICEHNFYSSKGTIVHKKVSRLSDSFRSKQKSKVRLADESIPNINGSSLVFPAFIPGIRLQDFFATEYTILKCKYWNSQNSQECTLNQSDLTIDISQNHSEKTYSGEFSFTQLGAKQIKPFQFHWSKIDSSIYSIFHSIFIKSNPSKPNTYSCVFSRLDGDNMSPQLTYSIAQDGVTIISQEIASNSPFDFKLSDLQKEKPFTCSVEGENLKELATYSINDSTPETEFLCLGLFQDGAVTPISCPKLGIESIYNENLFLSEVNSIQGQLKNKLSAIKIEIKTANDILIASRTFSYEKNQGNSNPIKNAEQNSSFIFENDFISQKFAITSIVPNRHNIIFNHIFQKLNLNDKKLNESENRLRYAPDSRIQRSDTLDLDLDTISYWNNYLKSIDFKNYSCALKCELVKNSVYKLCHRYLEKIQNLYPTCQILDKNASDPTHFSTKESDSNQNFAKIALTATQQKEIQYNIPMVYFPVPLAHGIFP